MILRCPKCNNEFEAERTKLLSLHEDYECECGQPLQWDWKPPIKEKPWSHGPPEKCKHEFKNEDAVVPLY